MSQMSLFDEVSEPKAPKPPIEDEMWETMTFSQKQQAHIDGLLEKGFHPGTRVPLLEGEGTCQDCVNLRIKRSADTNHALCAKVPPTDGRQREVLLEWPACKFYEEVDYF